MTKADVFYFVIAHLRAQNKRAQDEKGSCFYRTPEGLKRAAGCLITDEEYSPEFEGYSWETIAKHFPRYAEFTHMITDLQLLHDGCYVEFTSPRFDITVAVLEEKHLTIQERR
jgi:hypothetical protein